MYSRDCGKKCFGSHRVEYGSILWGFMSLYGNFVCLLVSSIVFIYFCQIFRQPIVDIFNGYVKHKHIYQLIITFRMLLKTYLITKSIKFLKKFRQNYSVITVIVLFTFRYISVISFLFTEGLQCCMLFVRFSYFIFRLCYCMQLVSICCLFVCLGCYRWIS